MLLYITEVLFLLILGATLYFIYRHERSSAIKISQSARIEEYWNGKERRQHYRFTKDLTVEYRIEKKPHLKKTCRSIDISEGGMKLLVDYKFVKGTILDLTVGIPDSHKKIEAEGEVLWVEEADGPDTAGRRLFHTGIRFIAIKEPTRQAFANYLATLAASNEEA